MEICVPITSQHSKDTLLIALWLMSSALVGPALELVREARFWFTSPSGCPFSALVLLAIGIGVSCFFLGLVAGCVLASHRCRSWLWHCLLGAKDHWFDSPEPQASVELRRRLRAYRA